MGNTYTVYVERTRNKRHRGRGIREEKMEKHAEVHGKSKRCASTVTDFF